MTWTISSTYGGSAGPHRILKEDGVEIGRLYEMSDDIAEAIPLLLKYYLERRGEAELDELLRP